MYCCLWYGNGRLLTFRRTVEERKLCYEFCRDNISSLAQARSIAEEIFGEVFSPDRGLSLIHIWLVCGSSQMGVFVDYLEALFSKRPTLAKHPEHTVALGVGLCAGIKQRCACLLYTSGCCSINGARQEKQNEAYL